MPWLCCSSESESSTSRTAISTGTAACKGTNRLRIKSKRGPQTLKGEIQTINLEKKTITIKDDISHATQDVDFNDSTTFSKDAKAITIGDLKKGDKISLDVDSQNIATKVEIAVPESVPPPQQKQ